MLEIHMLSQEQLQIIFQKMNLKLYNHLDSYANENCCRGGLMNSTKKISIINTQIINELGYKEIMQRKNLKSSIIPHNENENNNPNNQNRRISPNLLGLKQSNIRKKSSDDLYNPTQFY